jgi:MinD-like ATPase involved in chromosome partitioning or flagellar assembly
MAGDPIPAGGLVIRNLRLGPPALAESARSLAFSRTLVSRSGAAARAQRRPTRGFTIAVTSPRQITCKRGLAAHLAAHLAMQHADDDMSVCVVDADIESRDIGVRFGVAGPLLLDVAKRLGTSASGVPIDELIARVDPLGLHVLPTRPPEPALASLLRSKTPKIFAPLAATFDIVVVDAPVGLGVDAPEHDAQTLERIDALLVAVTADPSAFGSLLRYLNVIEAAVERGKLPATFDVHVVLTGSDHDGTRTVTLDDVERKLEGLPVAGWVPQLWGRGRPGGPLSGYADRTLHDAFDAIVERVTAVPHD